jgi:acetaldehyde dehydrogenase (acetylating)
MDKDLVSIQEARDLATKAFETQKVWSKVSQADVDRVCAAMSVSAYDAAERLGRMAYEETGYGVPLHKKLKNEFAARNVWQSIKDIKTVGVIGHDPLRKVYEIAWPMGVVCGLTPSTNPTSTVIAKALMAVKARNAIVFSPHPSAARCSLEAARLLQNAAEEAGAPKNLVSCFENVSLPGTQELMNHKYIAVILATGGSPMVKAAHSVGKPAYGVGPGNVPVYVDRSADLEKAARYVVASKAFDHSTICATEQAVIADRPIARQLELLMKAQGAFFVDEQQAQILRRMLFTPEGAINPASVGKSPQVLAGMAGIQVPKTARILVAKLNRVGREEPLSREKLTTVLGWYEADGWEQGCERSIEMIQFGGRGHTQIIYATDEKVIMAFGLEKPVFRILVNTMGTLGAIGLTTGVMPSMTLGAGGVGGSITGDNVTTYHLFNVKRLAYELSAPPSEAFAPSEPSTPASLDVEKMVEKIVSEILKV